MIEVLPIKHFVRFRTSLELGPPQATQRRAGFGSIALRQMRIWGHAEIHSAPGQGTAVTLYLPRPHEVDVPAIPTPLKFEAEAHEGATILVVDDESMMRALIAEVLERMGHIVIGVADAAAAMRVLLSTAAIDLLIADVGLPGGMNGYQLTELARHHRPNLKVLFVTGYVGAEPMIAPAMDNDTQLLAKPFSLNALASRVKRLVPVARDETAECNPSSKRPPLWSA